jgi:hypothetical protein
LREHARDVSRFFGCSLEVCVFLGLPDDAYMIFKMLQTRVFSFIIICDFGWNNRCFFFANESAAKNIVD